MRSRKTPRWLFVLFCALALTAFACHKESTENTTTTDTYASSSSSATDTSATTATDTGAPATSAPTSTSTSGGTVSALDPADQEFMTKAAQGGLAEVSLGQLASSKATNADVKAFGDRMVTDHSKLNDELKQLAQTKGVTLPTDVDKASMDTTDKLTKATGKTFDKDYINDMVTDHEKDVKEFEKLSKSAKDADLKTWVTNSLPTLQDHLKMAKEAKSKLK